MRTDFVIIGAQKCATTTITSQCARHPQICFSRQKEPHFFSRHPRWRERLEDYHKLYDPQPGQLCGEGSTSYTFFPRYPHVPRSLHDYNPNMRLIYIVRDPVDRMVSLWMHRALRGAVKRPFHEAVFADPGYVNVSRYGMQLRQYLRYFQPEQILVLEFGEYVNHPRQAWERISAHLDIAPADEGVFAGPAENASSGEHRLRLPVGVNLVEGLLERLSPQTKAQLRKFAGYLPQALFRGDVQRPELDQQLRERLWALVEDDVRVVEDFLGRRLRSWRRELPQPPARRPLTKAS